MSIAVFAIVAIALLLLGVPIAATFGLASILYILTNDIAPAIVMQRLFAGLDSAALLCIPFFVLAGEIMSSGGIALRLVNLVRRLVGNISGGLAIVTIISCTFFAAVTGSGVACCAALGAILIPYMVKDGYDRAFATAVTSAGSTLGPIIPPSITLVMYGQMTSTSISTLYKIGVPAGLFLALIFGVLSFVICKLNHYGPKRLRDHVEEASEKTPAQRSKERREALSSLWALGTPVIILGSIFAGLATPTEASVVAVVYSLIVSLFIYREMKIKDLPRVFGNAVKGTARIMFIIAAANIFAWILTYLRIPDMIVESMLSVTTNEILLLILVNVLMLVLGMLMDSSAIMYICIPIFVPLLTKLNVDLLHFGIVMVVNMCVGIITPPFGTVLFTGCATGKVSMLSLTRKLMPYIVAMIAFVFLLTFAPGIVMWIA